MTSPRALPQVHPLWVPFEPVDSSASSAFVSGKVPALAESRIVVVPASPEWPRAFERFRERLLAGLGNRALSVTHIGSTSVVGLAAKPVLDIDLLVADSSDEDSYRADLEALGGELTVREPDWQEHRMFRFSHPAVNLHVFSPGTIEPQRHVVFRDWLRLDSADRERYAAFKTELAQRSWRSTMEYNAAKAALVYDIYERAFLADPGHPHTPQPRS